MAKVFGGKYPKRKIIAIDFRHKQFGWDASFLKIMYKDGSCWPHLPRLLLPLLNIKKGKLFYRFFKLSFHISNLYERPSCHACLFKGLDKLADFSMGDLWGVKKTYPTQYDKQGVSALLVNTTKAQNLFKKLNLRSVPIDVQKIVQYNPYLLASVKPHPKRAEFFARYKTENFNKLVKRMLPIRPIWLAIPLHLGKKIAFK